jgi:hypothetical protein
MIIIGALPSEYKTVVKEPINYQLLQNMSLIPEIKKTSTYSTPIEVDIPFKVLNTSIKLDYLINQNLPIINNQDKELEKLIKSVKDQLDKEFFLGEVTTHNNSGWTTTPVIGLNKEKIDDQLTVNQIYWWSHKLKRKHSKHICMFKP